MIENPELHGVPGSCLEHLLSKTPMAGTSPAIAKPRLQIQGRSGVRQIETVFDPFDAAIDTIESVRKIGVLALENAETGLHLAHVIAKAIDGAVDGPQMFQDNIVRLAIDHFHSILVIS
jgi:hypothetical protein